MSSTFISCEYINNGRDKSEEMESSSDCSDCNPICVSVTVQVTVTQYFKLCDKIKIAALQLTFLYNCFIRSADELFLKHVHLLGRTGTLLD